MTQPPATSNVIEFPRVRESALNRLYDALADKDIPLERLWSMCRVVESLAACDSIQTKALEKLAREAAGGMCLSVTYSDGRG